MTETQQLELEALKRMMETDGWRVFHREHSEQLKNLRLTSWDSIKTQSELDYMKGFLACLHGIVNYEHILDQAIVLEEPLDG